MKMLRGLLGSLCIALAAALSAGAPAAGQAPAVNAAVNVFLAGDTWLSRMEKPVEGAGNAADYGYERGAGRFTYYFDLPNGRYKVSLGTAEQYGRVAGERVFSVDVNDTPWLKDLDLAAEAGGNRAVVKTTDVEVRNGQLKLAFRASKDAAKFDYLAIEGTGVSFRLVAGSDEDKRIAAAAGIYEDRLRANTETGVMHNANLNSGMPLGGIGCGKVELYPDGSFSQGTFNNNWDYPIREMNGCFGAVWMNAGGKTVAKSLTLASPYGLPCVSDIDFRGTYPSAQLSFPDPDLPLSLSVRAFSPIIPHDIKNSSLPVAILVFTLKNESRGPVDAAVAVSWENLLGVGGNAVSKEFRERAGNRVSQAATSVGVIGLHMEGPEKAKAPEDRLRYNAAGDYSLLAQANTPEAKATVGAWDANLKSVAWWDQFAREGTVGGTVPPGEEWNRHPAGVAAIRVSLKDKEVREIPFVVVWYTPRFYTSSGAEYGHLYEKSFKDSLEVGHYALENRLSLAALTEEWQDRLLNSTLPTWFSRKLLNDAATLTTNTLLTRDSAGVAPKNGPSLFATLSDPGDVSAAIGALDERVLGHAPAAALFPTLDVSELKAFSLLQQPSGELPRLTGNACVALVGPEAKDAPQTFTEGADLAASFAYQVAAYYHATGDQAFLNQYYPAVKHALEHAVTLDRDGDGIPEGSTVLDLLQARGAFSYTATLWLAALRIGEDLAGAIADRPFAGRCHALYAKALASTRSLLWTGSSLREWAVPDRAPGGAPTPGERSDKLMAYALAGQWMADTLDLGDLLPEGDTEKAVDTLVKLSGDRAPFGAPVLVNPAAEWEVDWRCWPGLAEAFQAGVYAAHGRPDAALALARKVYDLEYTQSRVPWAAPAVFRADRGQFEGGGRDNRFRSMMSSASWCLLQELQGVTVDLANSRLRIEPHVPSDWKSFSAPIFAPSFWANMEFVRGPEGQKVRFRLDRMTPVALASLSAADGKAPAPKMGAALTLKQVTLPAGAGGTPQIAAVLGRAPVVGQSSRDARGRLVFTFNAPVVMTAGQTLEFAFK